MSEQNALDEVLGDRAAVDGHERLAGALALALDGARDQLLADARLTLDQHGDVGGGGALAERDDALHRLAANDEIVEGQRPLDLLLDAADLARERLDAERGLDGDLEPLGRGGLDDEIGRARAHRADGRIDRTVRGLDDDRGDARPLREPLEDGHAVDARHHEVEQHEADRAAVRPLEDLDGLLAGIGGSGLEALPLDHLFQDATLGRIVVDD